MTVRNLLIGVDNLSLKKETWTGYQTKWAGKVADDNSGLGCWAKAGARLC